jgi:hypothetical protein
VAEPQGEGAAVFRAIAGKLLAKLPALTAARAPL